MYLLFYDYIAYTYKLYSTYGVPKISWLQILLTLRYFEDSMDDFHSCTVHLDNIKVFYLPTDAR
jgi:hypothetical protein